MKTLEYLKFKNALDEVKFGDGTRHQLSRMNESLNGDELMQKIVDSARVLVVSDEIAKEIVHKIHSQAGTSLMSPSDARQISIQNIQLEYEPLNLPFNCTWFEGEKFPLFAIEGSENKTVYGILLYQTYDGDIVVNIYPGEENKKITIGFLNETTINNSTGARLIYAFVKMLLDRISNKSISLGRERVNIQQRTGTGNNRKLTKIKDLVRVCLTANIHSSGSLYGQRIDWSHRWEVMGHWRRVANIGKDKIGNYTMKGFTWIAPFVKGPEFKDLVHKIRVVGDEKAKVKQEGS